MTCDEAGTVRALELADNELAGTLPELMLSLESLNLAQNLKVSGSLASELIALDLNHLYLHDTALSGHYPPLPTLQRVYDSDLSPIISISNSSISGTLPTGA